jgi:hypothetical protein
MKPWANNSLNNKKISDVQIFVKSWWKINYYNVKSW